MPSLTGKSVLVCSWENTTPSFLHCWRSCTHISLMLMNTFSGWLFIVSPSALRNLEGLFSAGLSHMGRQSSWAGQHPGHLSLASGTHQIYWNHLSWLCLQSEVSRGLLSGSRDPQTPEKICQLLWIGHQCPFPQYIFQSSYKKICRRGERWTLPI